MQLSIAARVRAPAISPSVILSPFISLSFSTGSTRPGEVFLTPCIPRLSSILAGSLLADSLRSQPGGPSEDEAVEGASE